MILALRHRPRRTYDSRRVALDDAVRPAAGVADREDRTAAMLRDRARLASA